MLHLGSAARVAFAAAWIALQGALIVTADSRPDRIFGFRMFPEASTMQIHLLRDVGETEVNVPRGEWMARDASGQLRSWSWTDRIRDPVLSHLDTRLFASYGLSAQLARLKHALDDVADHIPEDMETVRLVARVECNFNGRDESIVTLRSHRRSGR